MRIIRDISLFYLFQVKKNPEIMMHDVRTKYKGTFFFPFWQVKTIKRVSRIWKIECAFKYHRRFFGGLMECKGMAEGGFWNTQGKQQRGGDIP